MNTSLGTLPLSLTFLAADYYAALEGFAAVVAILILISSLDDLFIDLWYWIRRFYRQSVVEHQHCRLTVAQLQTHDEQPIAIMIPAWLEHDVIAAMIENLVATLDYRHYLVFIGTYVNDSATIIEVERMLRRYGLLRRVEVPHAGPTCKADCLNWILEAIFAHESAAGVNFAGVVLHDSEDVLHPLELKFFNYLLPRKDMIQLPVASLEREWYELVAGTYMDEFAENHAKDMSVRESLTGMIPSAGVGTCFSRRALLALRGDAGQPIFNSDSLTEDYDVGMRLASLGMRSIFARFQVQYRVRRKSWWGGGQEAETLVNMPLCVREYFPDTFHTACRQKARWVLGIGLQSWEQISWKGSLAERYVLLHDRKGVITAFISMMAYLLTLQFIIFYFASVFHLWTVYYPPLFAEDGWWRDVMYFNGATMISRALHRVYFVTPMYGWRHGLMSLPRLIVANFVNFFAVCRAWRLFLSYLFLGTPLVWDKTMHDYPDPDHLGRQHQRLGDLLKTWQAVDGVALEQALDVQRNVRMPLGSIMLLHGWLDEETLTEALAYQANLSRVHLTEELIKANFGRLPTAICLRWRVVPIGAESDGRLSVAVTSALTHQALDELAAELGIVPLQRIARESEIIAALRFLSEQAETFAPSDTGHTIPLLGDLLISLGLLHRHAFETAMHRYRPERHGRIGDYLVDQGVVQREVLEKALDEQRQRLWASDAQTI